MLMIADLHIHSRFSRATSKDCDASHLDWWARRKGIHLIGTGDFTHPAWRAELKEQLVPAETGVYTLRKELCLPDAMPGPDPRFVVSGEISSIYKRDGKTRKVHNVILLPSLEAADELSAKLESIGNIHSDGRPILGLDSRDLLELTLETCPDAEFIPAHIWTPHFSMFGAFSEFDTIEACFGDLTPYIHAVETGLSSDPPMNWRVSMLDHLTLVSHSDAHSPSKLGREANLLDTGLAYPDWIHAIRTGEGFLGTIEFFPEEGKYHLDGHRNCGVCLTPTETAARNGLCPVCGKKLTIGVEHRVEELADRPAGFRPPNAKSFESLSPLPEVIAATSGWSVTSKKNITLYEQLLHAMGSEFYILRQAPIEEINQVAGPCLAEGIRRLRIGQVERRPGFDGEYGTISLLTPYEREQFSGQTSLFAAEISKPKPKAKSQSKLPSIPKKKTSLEPRQDTPNLEQQAAVSSTNPITCVIAGPGTGKTKTLVSRIAYLIEELGVKPSEITAVTFTKQAAAEMKERLQKRLGGKRAIAHMTIGTFHAICRNLLGNISLISPEDALSLASEILRDAKDKQSPKSFLQAVSRIKNGASCLDTGLDESLYHSYCEHLKTLQVLDFDDLLTQALKLDVAGRKTFTHLLVDEFQDINQVQYDLIQSWNHQAKSLFVIGDPDQSIYGFRGATGNAFEQLLSDFPNIQQIRLVENYRSTPQVLQASLPIVKQPCEHLRANIPSGRHVRVIQTHDDFSEGVWIAKEIARITGGVDMLEAQNSDHDRENHAFSDIAVLCRTHRQLQLIETCLQHDDIPCVINGRDDSLNTPQIRGVLSFFQSLQHPDDTLALQNSLSLLWDCPADLIQKIQQISHTQTAFDPERFRPAAQDDGHLQAWLSRCEEWLPLIHKEKPWKLIEHWEKSYGTSPDLKRLRNIAVFHDTISDFLDTLWLGQEADIHRASGKRWESGAVRLMTLHASKGLEFPVVFVAGVKNGTIPLDTKGHPTDHEEERRLLYVGMTRAQKELILTTSLEPSPFLSDLPDSVLQESPVRLREHPAQQLSLF